MKKREFDVVVIGAGSGLIISSKAAELGLKTAIIEEREFGGTCLNRGCIPSKMLIHTADVIEIIKNSSKFGINSKLDKIDWNKIQKRVWNTIDSSARNIEKGNREENITIFKKRAEFVGERLLKVGNELITGKKIFICAGTRPNIPEINGLDKVKYYTSDNIMRLKKLPKKILVMGGGYISAELSHVFASVGSEVTIVYRGERLLKNEDKEISETYTRIASKKYNLMLNTNIIKVSKKDKSIKVELEQKGKKKNLITDILLLTTGRIPNSDILKVKNTNVKVDKKGFILVDEYLETNVKGVYAIGDIIGKYLLKHSANLEAGYCANNAFSDSKIKIDYSAMPHAIFTSPQIASVGFTEEELKEIKYLKGKYNYYDTGMGMAIEDKDGFVKVLVDANSKKILGCHIIGSDAPTLIHEVIVAMKNNLTISDLIKTIHIHPALNEVVLRAFLSVDREGKEEF